MILRHSNPSTLLVSPSEQAATQAIENALQKLWCKTGKIPCGCACCRMIKNQNHYHQMIITPEIGYKIEHIKPVLHITRYTRDESESFVFIFNKAETLTPAVANRLLILLEEPPAGYYFILVTKNIDVILPTIVSRCFVHTISRAQDQIEIPALCQVFIGFKLPPITQLYSILKETKPDHLQTRQMLDLIRTIHIKELFKHYDHVTSRAKKKKIIETINHFSLKLPRQGGSDLFWKLLYISWPP